MVQQAPDDSPRPSKRLCVPFEPSKSPLSSAEDALLALLASQPDDTPRQHSDEGPSSLGLGNKPIGTPTKLDNSQPTLSGGNRREAEVNTVENDDQGGKPASTIGPPPRPLFLPSAPTPGPEPVPAGFQDAFSSFGDLLEPLVLIATLLFELQQRVAGAEAGTRLQSHQVEMLGQTALATRRTIRAMVNEWRDLVVKMQGAVAEHTLGLQQHREAVWGLEQRVTRAETEAQNSKKETLALKKEVHALRETMVTMVKLAEGQEALRRKLEDTLSKVVAAQKAEGKNSQVVHVTEDRNKVQDGSRDVAAAAEGGVEGEVQA